MKNLILAMILLIPFLGRAQAHLGSTLNEIKNTHPEKEFTVEKLDDGTLVAETNMPLGTFLYFFDNETGLSNLCVQVPDDLTALNTQVEIYNKKYVIISETSWKAYLEGGGVMRIHLNYDEDIKNYIFTYTD